MNWLPLLGLIFVTLKLARVGVVAGWPWSWVLTPFLLMLGWWIVCFIAAVAMKVAEELRKK